MVARTYAGLGSADAAAAAFERLTPFAAQLLALRADCAPLGPDDMAVGIALDGLQTAAFHFTRRRSFYHQLETPLRAGGGNGRLADRREAVAAFDGLTAYSDALLALQARCRPFGRDYMALSIARQTLETAAFHFTREANYYGAKSDSAGAVRPPPEGAP